MFGVGVLDCGHLLEHFYAPHRAVLPSMTELLYEAVLSDNVRIDRQAGIIFDVKIIGCESKNGRHYPNQTLRDAIPLYENSKVNLDHPEGDPRKPRSYLARFGVIRNVHLRENEGLFADFLFNPKHAVAEQLLWDAENSPGNVGFSHNVEALVRRGGRHSACESQRHSQGTADVVERIVAVRSVDLVADPATTQGLFEAVQPITLEQIERLIEERLMQERFRESKPKSREQTVTGSTFDSKAFAEAVTRY